MYSSSHGKETETTALTQIFGRSSWDFADKFEYFGPFFLYFAPREVSILLMQILYDFLYFEFSAFESDNFIIYNL